jgi:hypothetical protein
MGSVSVPFAFSVHHFINSVGADAGFAAIIGLAILILLYFAHARETASLREQIYEWAQRVQQLEARVTQLSRQQASLPTPSEPVPDRTMTGDTRAVPAAGGAAAAATAAATAAAPRPAAAQAPPGAHPPAVAGAPAGVAAPALTAATKLIPTYADVAPEPAAAGGGPGPVSAGQLPPDATAVVAPPPQPATVAGGANGSSYERDPTPPPSLPQGQPRGAAGTMPPAPPRMQLRQETPPPGRRGTTPPRNQPPRPQRTRGRRTLALVLVALVAVAVIAGVFVLTSGGETSHKQTNARTTSSNVSSTRHRTTNSTAPITPSSVTVAVLNGTITQGLAGRVSQKLATEGYKPGRFTTAADQTRTSTEVAYMPGHRPDALLVAKSLNLGSASVQPVDQSTHALACPPALGACTATVVVTLGTDLANTAVANTQ